ncbi:MAG TPA: SIMPL domain-containing protein [Blastocatellia bacterium]|nr:SIMPL domain-containing protein [Blastocatellia bacterium]
MKRGAFVIAVLGIVGSAAFAQGAEEKTARPVIRVMGEATVSARPDQATVHVGVVTQASTAQEAASQNAQKLDAVIQALRKALGPQAEIKTISYSLNPNYVYPREGGQPKLTGYTASNTVEVKTGDLAQVGKIIDTATQAGANNIQALRFGLKDEEAVKAQALREATAKARVKADAIANALGVKIVRFLRAEESGAVAIPFQARDLYSAREAAAAVPTPVDPGNVEVRASITLTFEVSS